MVSGTYHYKKLGKIKEEDSKIVEVPEKEGNLPETKDYDRYRKLTMARVMIINRRAMSQAKEKRPYVDVDGMPTGFVAIKRPVFEEFKIPPIEEWNPFGTGDLAMCERVKVKWLIRLLKQPYAYHLYMNKKGEIVVY
ncbi:unnamed protein product [marine sediment metagenome]|uniref:Uncharacterized protein n=1 Tax=marine sediment metagenome TaxID=412755 RepID=X1GRW0_9ZZZZ